MAQRTISTLLFLPFFSLCSTVHAQCSRWQQEIDVDLHVNMDVRAYGYTGRLDLNYTNNSPDTLHRLYFHLYPNAFKPGSEMDIRSRTIVDPDKRIGERIGTLKPEEEGMLRSTKLEQEGKVLSVVTSGTVMWADLTAPILPGSNSRFSMDFEGRVPLQIRRSGRNGQEGVDLSMTQWYPKVAAYDDRGWHADPYVAREFYGEWGEHDLYITIDSAYTVAATGVLQEPERIGHGYAPRPKASTMPLKDGRLTWHFKASRVHDLAWSADPEYIHTTTQVPDGPLLHFFRLPNAEFDEAWAALPAYMVRSFQYMNVLFGEYAWPVYSFAQGGDGGMEYPMLTLITGQRRLGSLVGVSVHESVHSWFYGMLANDEGQYPWMDEGFAEFAGDLVMQELFGTKEDPHAGAFGGYFALVGQPDDEPMSVHADHFLTNRAYGITSYGKGNMLLVQLGAVIGEQTVMRGMRRYFEACKFKHPTPIDVELAMEKESGLMLDWYFNEWINTIRRLDTAVDTVASTTAGTRITLERRGDMVMPADVLVVDRQGKRTHYHIPLSMMLGARKEPLGADKQEVLPAWQWPDPTYTFTVPQPLSELLTIRLDPTQRTADIDRTNDVFPREAE